MASPSSRGKSGGGADFAAFAKSMESDLRLAGAQARHLTADAKDAELPGIKLTADLWPPVFASGAIVFFEKQPLEGLASGSYVLARIKNQTAICRFLDWRFDGGSMSVSLMTRAGASTYGRERHPGTVILGVVMKVRTNNGDVEPNRMGIMDKISGALTDFGTTSVPAKLGRVAREMIEAVRKPKRKSEEAGFVDMLRQVRESEKAREATRPRKSGDAYDLGSSMGSGDSGLMKDMNFKGSGY